MSPTDSEPKASIELKEATEFFKPFPEADKVFSGDVKKHSQLLLPIATVELSYLNEKWNGVLPVVMPIEPGPGQGLFGDGSEEHHDYLCRNNWIGYHLHEGKIQFAGDWKLFNQKDNQEYYADVHAGYQTAKQYFQENKCLHSYYGRDKTPVRGKKVEILAWLGGDSTDANWAHSSNFPLKTTERKKSETIGYLPEYWPTIVQPLTSDQRTFEYIGLFKAFNFINGDNTARWAVGFSLVVFYDPQENIVLTTFDFT